MDRQTTKRQIEHKGDFVASKLDAAITDTAIVTPHVELIRRL